MSRPRAVINLKKVEDLASSGLSVREIAAALGISRSAFYSHMETNPDIMDKIRAGRSGLVAECVNMVRQAAQGGDWRAAEALAKRYSDLWRNSPMPDEKSALERFLEYSN